jgi:hypothetical protein
MQDDKKFEKIDPSTQFSMLIPNIVVLLHRKLGLMMKKEN